MRSTLGVRAAFILFLLLCCSVSFAQSVHNYVFFGMDRQRITEANFLNAKGIEGAQLKYSWRQLEQGKDNYVFDDLRRDLAFLNSKGKKLFIQVQDASFSVDIVPVPKYLLNDPQFHGGVAPQCNVENDDVEHAKPYGWVARRWDPAVQERYQKLLMALGKEFDGKIEGINLPETAIDVVASGSLKPRGFSAKVYRDAVVANMKVLKQAFPKSVAMQYANFMPEEPGSTSPEYLSSIYKEAIALKVGLGGPDLLPNREYQMIHSYPMLREAAGRVPTGIAVQDGNYDSLNPKTKKPVTLPELVEFGTGYLKVRYIFWCTQEPFYSRDVIPYLSRTAQ